MPTQLNRIEILLTDAQLAELRLRFPEVADDKAAIYFALGLKPPTIGRPKGSRNRRPRKGRSLIKADKPA